MEYYLCEFEYGYVGQFYMVVENGYAIKYVDLFGNDMLLEPPYGYNMVIRDPVTPEFL
jgi:hypothetical protein